MVEKLIALRRPAASPTSKIAHLQRTTKSIKRVSTSTGKTEVLDDVPVSFCGIVGFGESFEVSSFIAAEVGSKCCEKCSTEKAALARRERLGLA
jgi:hypothetical protein